MQDNWIGLKEASDLLRCDPGHVNRMAEHGELHRKKINATGRTFVWRYRRDEVEALHKKEIDELQGKFNFPEAINYLKKKGINQASKTNVHNWRKKGWVTSETSKYYPGTLIFSKQNLDDFVSIYGPRLRGKYNSAHGKEAAALNQRGAFTTPTLRSKNINSAIETAQRDPWLGLAQAVLKYLMDDYIYALERGNKEQIRYFETCIRTDYFYNLTLQKINPEDVIQTYRSRYLTSNEEDYE